MEMEILQNLGFTQAEGRTYLTLLELGPTKVGRIIEKSGLQSSTIHNVLNSLAEKGFVTYILKGKIKIYQAINPSLILKHYKEREKQFEEIIPKLEAKQKLVEAEQVAEIYEGMQGLNIMLSDFIEYTKPKDHFYFFSVDVPGMNKEIQKFFEKFDVKRQDKKLIVKGIARKELKQYYKKRKLIKVKYVEFPIPSNLSICNDKIALISWGEKPTGILIKSKQLAESQKRFFENIWNIAKV